jgi:hypothetical protein
VIKRLLIPGLLACALGAPAHDWVWLPPQPAGGVSPCAVDVLACPPGLRHIFDELAAAQQRRDTVHVRYWTDRLAVWYAFNPDYRPHYHPHR